MNILVTGGAGYIGSLMVLQLIEKGYNVVIIDNLSKGHKKLIFSDKFYKVDIRNKDKVKEIILTNKIDMIIHFAAFIEAGESMKNPAIFFNNNTVGSLNLLDAAIETGVKYFIFSSTAAVYGYPDKVPVKEDAKLNPVNVYGDSKLFVEKILKWYNEIYGLNYISLRYFNACGADKQLRTGEMHEPETHIIPLAIKTALNKRDKFYIFGTDYNTKDGTCIRDYIHVEDLVDAHILSIDYLLNTNKSEIFNLGSETEYSVKTIVNAVKKVTKVDFPVIETDRRPGDPDILIASSKKIKKMLGWSPQYNDIEKIIYTAYQWELKSIKN